MTNPYIQNFINARQQEYNSSVLPNIAMQGEAKKGASKSNIRPENPKGYIVKENALQSAGSYATELGKTADYFKDAFNGKGTDYSVGRINDGARFLGSLGIAAALASTAKNPKAKLMEFVGFATWFASMALWPKILGSPIKALKGVDINQEYVDSYGRRKRFFEDAQYLNWDLYGDKDLQKLGDKLGVPTDIKNRKDAVKEKARQVAVQGNTLMMLTAGFATPVATALVCNRLEGPVSKALEMRGSKEEFEKLLETNSIVFDNNILNKLNKIVETGDTAQIKNFFKQFNGTSIEEGVSGELEEIIGSSQSLLNAEDAKTLHKSISLGDGALRNIVGNEHLESVKKALESINQDDFNKIVEYSASKGVLNKEEKAGFQRQVRGSLTEKLYEVEGLSKAQKSKIIDAVQQQLGTEIEKHSKINIDGDKVEKLYKTAHEFVTRKGIADKYAKATIANIADSQTAGHWEKAPAKILKALGIEGETLKLIADNPSKAAEYIKAHLEKLVNGQIEGVKLEGAVEKIAKIANDVVEKENEAAKKLKSAWTQTGVMCGQSAQEFSHLNRAVTNAVNLEKASIENKIANTKSSFFRPLMVLERIKDGSPQEVVKELISGFGIDFWSNKGEHIKTNGSKIPNIGTSDDYRTFVDNAFKPVSNILKEKEGMGAKINEFYQQSKLPLFQIDGANRRIYHPLFHHREKLNDILDKVRDRKIQIGEKKIAIYEKQVKKIDNILNNLNTTKSAWAEKVGKTLNDFIRDAAVEKRIKDTWLHYRVLPVAGAILIAGVIPVAIFGRKNKYNPEIYEPSKGAKL